VGFVRCSETDSVDEARALQRQRGKSAALSQGSGSSQYDVIAVSAHGPIFDAVSNTARWEHHHRGFARQAKASM